MALVMAYADEFGSDHPASHWRVVSLSVSVPGRVAACELWGWKDAAAWAAGKKPVGRKAYTVAGDGFDNYMASYLGGQTDLFALAYMIARADAFFAAAVEV